MGDMIRLISTVDNTNSQKSIATDAHSQELRDADDSSGKASRRTYVLAADSGSGGSEAGERSPARPRSPAAPAAPAASAAVAVDAALTKNDAPAEDEPGDDDPETALRDFFLLSQETYTQTSKTILELAQTNYARPYTDTSAIETQTSRVSIVENKTIEYRIEVSRSQTLFTRNELPARARRPLAARAASPDGSGDSGTLRIIDDGPETESTEETEHYGAIDIDTSRYDTEFTDSLDDYGTRREEREHTRSDDSVPKSVDRDVEELYTNLEKSFDLRPLDRPGFDVPRYVAMSPLTEETIAKPESVSSRRVRPRTRPRESPQGKTVKTSEPTMCRLPLEDKSEERWRLPPIRRQQAGSPRRRACSPGPRAETRGARDHDRLDARACDWAAGENVHLAARIGPADPHRLPAIRERARTPSCRGRGDGAPPPPPPPPPRDIISIGGKIQQLKMLPPENRRLLYPSTSTDSRSSSPGTGTGAGAGSGAGADVTARGCDALCADIIARLRQACSCSRMTFEQHVSRHESSDNCGAKWAAAVEVLEDIPRLFRGFWPAVPEHRVADLSRLVTAQVESPRTRVARAACAALAALLSHTGYTKKPEFDEAVAALLGKTGSMASALRRASNLALDQLVAAAPSAPAVSALCLFGAEHKSALVRCAAARLLVVACALAAGGRGVLRARPRSAADARRLALRALAALLDDRSQDTRRYAERLYALLRPLPGFEAFFLADAGARAACRLFKKHDPLLGWAGTSG